MSMICLLRNSECLPMMYPVNIKTNKTAAPSINMKFASGQCRILKRIPIVAILQAIPPTRLLISGGGFLFNIIAV